MANSKKQFTFIAEPDIKEILEAEAERQERSIIWVVNHYLRKAFEMDKLLQPKQPKRRSIL
jgi:hypothetical protein